MVGPDKRGFDENNNAKRQFIGESIQLSDKLITRIETQILNTFK